MFSLRQRSRSRDTVSMAGWLFADLLLGLAMFFLVANSVGITPLPTPSPTPTATSTPAKSATPRPSTTPTSSATPTKVPTNTLTPTPMSTEMGPPGLSDAQCYAFDLDSRNVIAQKSYILNNLMRSIPNDSEYPVGMFIVWAEGDAEKNGWSIAREVVQIIQEHFPESFGAAKTKSLFYDFNRPYHVHVEVYFISSNKKWESHYEVGCELYQPK